MDFFAINQANGVLSINTDAFPGDSTDIPNGIVPKMASLFQTIDIVNGDLPLPPKK